MKSCERFAFTIWRVNCLVQEIGLGQQLACWNTDDDNDFLFTFIITPSFRYWEQYKLNRM